MVWSISEQKLLHVWPGSRDSTRAWVSKNGTWLSLTLSEHTLMVVCFLRMWEMLVRPCTVYIPRVSAGEKCTWTHKPSMNPNVQQHVHKANKCRLHGAESQTVIQHHDYSEVFPNTCSRSAHPGTRRRLASVLLPVLKTPVPVRKTRLSKSSRTDTDETSESPKSNLNCKK